MLSLRALLPIILLPLCLGAQDRPAMSLAVQTGNTQLDTAIYKAASTRLSRLYRMTDRGSRSETGLVEIAAYAETESAPVSPLDAEGDANAWYTRWEALTRTAEPRSRKTLPQAMRGTITLLMRTTLPGGKETTVYRSTVNMTGQGRPLKETPGSVESFALGCVESLINSVKLNQK